jgi:hypothetical protein
MLEQIARPAYRDMRAGPRRIGVGDPDSGSGALEQRLGDEKSETQSGALLSL